MHLRHKSQTAMMILDYEWISDQVKYIQSQIKEFQEEEAIKIFGELSPRYVNRCSIWIVKIS